MDASLRAALESLVLIDYCSVAVITTICYDYLLTIGREVEFIWKRPWSLMSSLYVIIRYLGIFLAIINVLGGNFVYIPELTYVHRVSGSLWLCHVLIIFRCVTLFKFVNWGGYIYTLVLEAIMILRIFAMYNQSKRLLYILLLLFLPVVVVELVGAIVYFGPRNGAYAIVVPLAGFQVCTVKFSLSPLLYIYILIPGIVFDGVLATLAIIRLVQHTVEMRRVLGGCRINIWLRMLARDSVLYFIGNLMYRSLNLIPLTNLPPIYKTVAQAFSAVEPFVLPPRLVVSFRKYHAHVVAESSSGRLTESTIFRSGDSSGNRD